MQCASKFHQVNYNVGNNTNALLVSGGPPKVPVVSPKSGSLFEKQLIVEYINEHHKDPISSEPLELDDLIEIKVSPYQPPRQPTLNSIPSLLSSLQNEWDSVALELFQLRKQLDDTRKELSTALYHHDAAVRVASKAIKQRDEARTALQELTISISNGKQIEQQPEGESKVSEQQQQQLQKSTNGDEDVQLNDSTPPKEIEDLIINASTELFAIHKAQKQKVNVSISSPLNSLTNVGKHETKPYKKIVASNILDGQAYLTSSTGLTSIYNFEDEKYHKAEHIPKNKNIAFINNVLYNNELTPLIGTISGELIFNDGVKIGEGIHKSPIVSIISHPSLKHLFLSFDKAGIYALHDGTNLTTYFQGKLNNELVSASIHTDGALVAVGDIKGSISIIDLRNNEIVKTMESTDDSTITNLKFGPNGYWLFASYVSGESNFIKVWDLRKDSFETIQLINQVTRILTDKSSQLLVVLGYKSIEIVQYNKKGKEWIGKAMHSVEIDGLIVDGAIVDDSKEDELKLALVTDSSTVQQFTISS